MKGSGRGEDPTCLLSEEHQALLLRDLFSAEYQPLGQILDHDDDSA
jgi:hypothetical protein